MTSRRIPTQSLVLVAVGAFLFGRSVLSGFGTPASHLAMAVPFGIACAVALWHRSTIGYVPGWILWTMFGTSFAAVIGVNRSLGSPIEGGAWTTGVVLVAIAGIFWIQQGRCAPGAEQTSTAAGAGAGRS